MPAALVVLGVRADFEARCAGYPQLADAVQDRYLLMPMTGRQLRMMITRPAREAGSSVDADLTDTLLREITAGSDPPAWQTGAGGAPQAAVLPLLSRALVRVHPDGRWRCCGFCGALVLPPANLACA